MTSPAKRIRAISLDLDDTLWPVGPTIVRAERRAQAALTEHAPQVAARWDIHRLRALRAKILEEQPHLRHDLLQIRRLALQEAFADCGLEPAACAASIETTLRVFMAARNEVDLYPEVEACLQRLGRRYRIASLTNGNADLKVVGLAHLFHVTVSAHEHGTTKPDPALFHKTCEQLECAPAEVVHVGDDPDFDVRGAQNAGLQAVWINRNNTVWPGQDRPHEVPCLEALERWLENTEAGVQPQPTVKAQ